MVCHAYAAPTGRSTQQPGIKPITLIVKLGGVAGALSAADALIARHARIARSH
jgi:hypothetical protein